MALNVNSDMMAELEGNSELSQENIEAMNQMLQQSVGTDLEGGLQILGVLGLGLNVLSLIFFITTAIGLYKLSKKLGDKHSWLAFVPLIQLYTLIKTSGFTFWKGFIMLVLHLIVAMILVGILFGVLGALIISLTGNGLGMGAMMLTMGLLYIPMYFLFMYIATNFLFKGMAERALESNATAALMTLFPWCMLWIVANRIPDRSQISREAIQTPVTNTEL